MLKNEPLRLADPHGDLPADVCETLPEFQQELCDVRRQRILEVLLLVVFGEREEIEVIGVFQDLVRKVALRLRQQTRKVRDGLTLRRIQIRLHEIHQHRTAPPVLNGLQDIEQGFLDGFALGENLNVMPPWNLKNRVVF